MLMQQGGVAAKTARKSGKKKKNRHTHTHKRKNKNPQRIIVCVMEKSNFSSKGIEPDQNGGASSADFLPNDSPHFSRARDSSAEIRNKHSRIWNDPNRTSISNITISHKHKFTNAQFPSSFTFYFSNRGKKSKPISDTEDAVTETTNAAEMKTWILKAIEKDRKASQRRKRQLEQNQIHEQ